jgi:hypothetical protein
VTKGCARIISLINFFKGDINASAHKVIVAFRSHDNGVDGESTVFGILQERPIKCLKEQMTEYIINDEKFLWLFRRVKCT